MSERTGQNPLGNPRNINQETLPFTGAGKNAAAPGLGRPHPTPSRLPSWPSAAARAFNNSADGRNVESNLVDHR